MFASSQFWNPEVQNQDVSHVGVVYILSHGLEMAVAILSKKIPLIDAWIRMSSFYEHACNTSLKATLRNTFPFYYLIDEIMSKPGCFMSSSD